MYSYEYLLITNDLPPPRLLTFLENRCKLCRTIKRKCDGNTPCSNCIRREQECVYPEVDKRKKRYSIEYITNLENLNQQLQQQIQSIINLKDNPGQLNLKLSELVESSGHFSDNTETRLDSSYGSPVLSKSDAPGNGYNLVGEVGTSRVHGSNFHLHQNHYQNHQDHPHQQQSASESSTKSLPDSPYSVSSTSPQILRFPSQQFQQQTRQNLFRQTGLQLHCPVSASTSSPNTPSGNGSVSNDRTPPPLLPVLPTTGSALPTLLPQPRPDFDFTPKFFRGPSGKSNMAFGASTVYDADESMVMNVNQIQERWGNTIKLAKLKNVPEADDKSQSPQVIKKGRAETIEMITNERAKKYFDLAFKYFDRPILCYLIDRPKTTKLYEEICTNKNDLSKIEDILGMFPTNQFISIELIAALIASGALYDDNLDCVREYLTLLKTEMFIDSSGCLTFNESSYPKLQAMLVSALLELGLGELTTAWELSGFALRMGLDLGFDNFVKDGPDKDVNDLKNLVFWGSYIIDKYAGLIFGRITMLYVPPGTPMMFAKTEDDKLPHLAQLIIESQPMISCIYETLQYKDAEHSKRNFLHRYDLLQGYNQRLEEWKNSLPEKFYWNKEILINTVSDESVDHLLKIAYYLIFLIMNKPFLKLPIGSDLNAFSGIVDEIEIIMKYIPDDKYLLNLVMYYVLVLLIQSLLAQVSYTNINNYNQNLKFLHQLLFFVERMSKTLRVDVWLICKKVHSNFQNRSKELEELMRQFGEKLEPKYEHPSIIQHEQLYVQQQQREPQHHHHHHPQQQQQFKHDEDTSREHLSQYSDSQTNGKINPCDNMLQNDQFIKMVDTLFESDMGNGQQQDQQHQEHDFEEQNYQQQEPQQIPSQPELLDPTLFNSMLNENGSTFNSIFSFDSEGFGL